MARQPQVGQSLFHRHTTLGRTSLEEWSARRRDLYMTTQNIHKTDIHVPGEIRTRNPRKEAANTEALDCTAITYHKMGC